MIPDLLDVPAAARKLGKTEDWLRRKASAGEIPSRKIGRDRCFTEADIQAYIDACAFVAANPLAQSHASRNRRRRP